MLSASVAVQKHMATDTAARVLHALRELKCMGASTHKLLCGVAGQVDHGKHSAERRPELDFVGAKPADCSIE